MDVESRRGPVDRACACVAGGGAASAEMMTSVLEHAIEVLEHRSASCPRKLRKGVLELIERADGALEVVGSDWCDGVSRCGSDRVEALTSHVVAVEGLAAESARLIATSDEPLEQAPTASKGHTIRLGG